MRARYRSESSRCALRIDVVLCVRICMHACSRRVQDRLQTFFYDCSKHCSELQLDLDLFQDDKKKKKKKHPLDGARSKLVLRVALFAHLCAPVQLYAFDLLSGTARMSYRDITHSKLRSITRAPKLVLPRLPCVVAKRSRAWRARDPATRLG